MRSLCIVIVPPFFREISGIWNFSEPAIVKALISEAQIRIYELLVSLFMIGFSVLFGEGLCALVSKVIAAPDFAILSKMPESLLKQLDLR